MILDKLASIDTFILDVDGVLTTGGVLATDNGELHREFNIKDGYALQYAVKQGYTILIISGGNSLGVKKRLEGLGIKEVHIGVKDKKSLLTSIAQRLRLNLENALYMGDDLPDLAIMNLCGVKVCPNDAVWEVQDTAHIITKSNGGAGSVRETIQKVLTMQNKWKA